MTPPAVPAGEPGAFPVVAPGVAGGSFGGPGVRPAAPAASSGGPGAGSGVPVLPSGVPVLPSGAPALPSGAPAVPSGTPAAEAAVVPGPRDAVPAPGKVSVSVAAASTPGENGRGRRLSCTVALAVAGALAGGVVGLGALLRPWAGGDQDTSGSAPAPSRSAVSTPTDGAYSPGPSDAAGEPSPAPTSSGGTAAAIPARYLGTWEGQATGLGGTLPMGTFRLTVHQARVGEELGRLTQTDQLGAVCTDILTLKKVTRTQIVATSVGAKGNHPGCDPAPHPVQLTPTGDDLTYTSDSSAEGNPVSRMSKAD